MTTQLSQPALAGTSAKASPYANIVVALDGSQLAEQVLEDVLPLARMFGSKVTCVCALEPVTTTLMAEAGIAGGYVPYEQIAEAQDQIRAEDEEYLARMTRNLQEQGLDAAYEEPEGQAAGVIVNSARAHHADLIAMTTHGRSGLGRTVLGSVADRVVRTAPCPVLLVKNSPSAVSR